MALIRKEWSFGEGLIVHAAFEVVDGVAKVSVSNIKEMLSLGIDSPNAVGLPSNSGDLRAITLSQLNDHEGLSEGLAGKLARRWRGKNVKQVFVSAKFDNLPEPIRDGAFLFATKKIIEDFDGLV
jgi:hypothetical protein